MMHIPLFGLRYKFWSHQYNSQPTESLPLSTRLQWLQKKIFSHARQKSDNERDRKWRRLDPTGGPWWSWKKRPPRYSKGTSVTDTGTQAEPNLGRNRGRSLSQSESPLTLNSWSWPWSESSSFWSEPESVKQASSEKQWSSLTTWAVCSVEDQIGFDLLCSFPWSCLALRSKLVRILFKSKRYIWFFFLLPLRKWLLSTHIVGNVTHPQLYPGICNQRVVSCHRQ